jgi:hypothetical protein
MVSFGGPTTLGAGFFLFRFRLRQPHRLGSQRLQRVRIRHTSGAQDRWLEEVEPVLIEYANGSAKPVLETIERAKQKRVDDLDRFLGERFGKRLVGDLKEVHEIEEHRPIETLWDVTTAVTAYARTIPNNDRRIELEREAGKFMQLAAQCRTP